MLRETVNEFMNAKASAQPREETEPTQADIEASRERAKRNENEPSDIAGLEDARQQGEDQAIVAANKVDFPFFFPTLRTTGAAYQGTEPRTYRLRDEQGKRHKAYRLVLAKGVVGEYYGIQGMTWRCAADPRRPARDDRAQRPQADGLPRRQADPAGGLEDQEGRLLGLEHAHAVADGHQMIGIATSLKRLG